MGVGVRTQLGAVLQLVLTAWLADAVITANSNRPDLLPTDCGRRLVRPDEALRPFIVGPGNTSAYYGQYPWQARLVMYDANVKGYVHHCGGIIVSQEHVVTAAHCVVEVVPRRLLVRVGDLRFDDRELFEQEFAVVSYHVHSRFGTGTGLRHDVALLRLRRRVGPGIEFGRYVQPACLPADDTEYETFLPCEVSGWGRIADLAPISDVLRGVSVPLVSDAFCGAPEIYQDRFLPGGMFCSGPTGGGADSCEGDSGGPLVCGDADSGRFVAYGVVSSGDPLGCGQRPGLYTKLSAYVDWLLRRLELDQEEDAAPSTAVTAAPDAADRPQGDLGRPCSTPDGAAGFCIHLRDCPDLLPAGGEDLLVTLNRPLCGLDAATSPLLCCPGREPRRADCGRTSFSPPAQLGAAFAKNAANFPWMAAISQRRKGGRGTPFCGGAVISDRWVLTGATCAHDDRQLSVRLGDLDLQDTSDDNPNAPSFELDIIKVVRHPQFAPPENGAQDIALLKTASKISFSSTVGPLCLPDPSLTSTVPVGNDVIFAGWGAPRFGANTALLSLKWARVRVVDFGGCRSNYTKIRSHTQYFDAGSFCTKFIESTPEFSCAINGGDQGSVLMEVVREGDITRWYAVGLAVAGVGCGSEEFPDVNIALGPSVDWIQSVIATA
ncbi:transmembrane protease serine 9-like [Pollicipes pollicipes]|uniref:transmembrane protease serine 9-like n=1 Tax=Pollicipes pollicipes TaxID=41117 RepID=UPI00188519CD|nr:transmembrane protease serine 9-like [Pollicipes pollicipes]